MEPENQLNIPEEYQPISLGKYIGFTFLFLIPCVGFICMIVFACGAIKNKNIINWARAQLIVCAVFLVIYIIFLIIVGLGATIFSGASRAIYY